MRTLILLFGLLLLTGAVRIQSQLASGQDTAGRTDFTELTLADEWDDRLTVAQEAAFCADLCWLFTLDAGSGREWVTVLSGGATPGDDQVIQGQKDALTALEAVQNMQLPDAPGHFFTDDAEDNDSLTPAPLSWCDLETLYLAIDAAATSDQDDTVSYNEVLAYFSGKILGRKPDGNVFDCTATDDICTFLP